MALAGGTAKSAGRWYCQERWQMTLADSSDVESLNKGALNKEPAPSGCRPFACHWIFHWAIVFGIPALCEACLFKC